MVYNIDRLSIIKPNNPLCSVRSPPCSVRSPIIAKDIILI